MSDLLVHGGTGIDGVQVDVLIQSGRISAVGSSLADRTAVRGLDAGGAVVLPAFVESHLHLDKALLGASDGGLDAAIAATAERKKSFTLEDVSARADRVLGWALAAGTTQVRAHTEIDPTVGDVSIRALLALRERWAGRLRLQLAAFPQEGIEARPGTLSLLTDAIEHPDVVVGGCPYAEQDVRAARRHIDTVLDLAAERGLSADLHLDLADHLEDERFVLAEFVAQAVTDRGLQGRVAIGHVTTLGLLEAAARTRVIDALVESQVTVAALPATDLFLTQRTGRDHVHRGIAPARELHAAGAQVVLSSNNVRNGFTPTGRADPLDIGLLFARLVHASSAADMRWVIDMLSSGGRRLMDPTVPSGLAPGAAGDLVLLRGVAPSDVLSSQPSARIVVRGGEVVARTETTTWVADGLPTLVP